MVNITDVKKQIGFSKKDTVELFDELNEVFCKIDTESGTSGYSLKRIKKTNPKLGELFELLRA